MIYITGDTHIPHDIKKLTAEHFPQEKSMTKSDYVIICGDFGGVWYGNRKDDYWLNWLEDKNFTTLFVDGNHENFNKLYEYEIVDFCGGKARKIRDSVLHLMRGEVYTIDGKKFFAMGGASSHDIYYRKEGISWWFAELPSDEEYANALRNLEKHDYTVDYIISHCAAEGVQEVINPHYVKDRLTDFFEYVRADCRYERWFFGHYHEDLEVDERHTAVFNKVILIEGEHE
jgi:predicted phosphodiesterase